LAITELAQWKKNRAREWKARLIGGTGFTAGDLKRLFSKMLFIRCFEVKAERTRCRDWMRGYVYV
jgi:TPP-dependent pyruvate/acetoin dehydrogenase alpha subunit